MSPIDLQNHLSRLQNLELLARQVVEGYIIGLHKSPFHGFSVEFAEHRLYNPGDPVRHIDWRVYGRTDRVFVKKFEEETNLRCCILLDTSASMNFPQDEVALNKFQYSIVAAASLIELLKKQLDATSLAFFDKEISHLTECRSSSRHYRHLIGLLEEQLQKGGQGVTSNLPEALHQLAEQMHKRSLLIVLTDFVFSEAGWPELESALQHCHFNKHEVILFQVMESKQELNLEIPNRPVELIDLETKESIKLQPGQVREEYVKAIRLYNHELNHIAQQNRADLVNIDLSEPVEQVLNKFLLKRNKLL